MKKYFVFFLLFISVFLTTCDTCDGVRYQVHDKKEIGNGQCEYTMWAFTECAAWQKRDIFTFTEQCSLYQLSQIISKEDADKYR